MRVGIRKFSAERKDKFFHANRRAHSSLGILKERVRGKDRGP
jgi:hypothetical protein